MDPEGAATERQEPAGRRTARPTRPPAQALRGNRPARLLRCSQEARRRQAHSEPREAIALRSRYGTTRSTRGSKRAPRTDMGNAAGIHIDRIASAWFIRRFIDPGARLRFVDAQSVDVRPGELRFDMVGGDFSHEEDRCTFETLLARTGISNRALTEIGEIVHDIDLKDAKFGRPEAAGLEKLLIGLVLANPDDEARLERGFVLFDELYQSFRNQSPRVSKEVSE